MKKLFNSKKETSRVEHVLRSIQPLPGEEFDQRMAAAPWMEAEHRTEKKARSRLVYKLAGAGAGLLLLIGLFFTPAGRVLAEEIIQFFNQIAGNTFPLGKDEQTEVLPTLTPQPTYYPALIPADQVQPTHAMEEPTPMPTPRFDAEVLLDLDSMTARSLVDFSLLEPAVLPEDYRLTNIRFNEDQQSMVFTYGTSEDANTPRFVLEQGKGLTDLALPADAIRKTFTENGLHFTWITSAQTFDDGAGAALSWQKGGVDLRIEVFGEPGAAQGNLQPQTWLDVAAGLTSCPAVDGAKDYTCEVNRAGVAAGFTPWQFSQTPDGYSFKSVYYGVGMTSIWYSSLAGELGLVQSAQDFKEQETSDWFSVPVEAVQQVKVGTALGEYVNGSFVAKPGEDHATWITDSGQIRLRWKQGNDWLQFVKWGEPQMQPQELADLASDLTADPAQVHADQQTGAVEPMDTSDLYLTIADAQKAYGDAFLQPEVLPQGLPFSHARIGEGGNISLFYGDFAEDKFHANNDVLMLNQGPKGLSFEETYGQDFPAQAVTDTQVNGHPAKLISGTMQIGYDENGNLLGEPTWKTDPYMLTLYWEVDQRSFVLQFFAGAQGGARLDAASLIEIAESLE
ncbi:MAG: hypothetical protein PWQ55_1106 [Chloroflexota bacterium]|nr:hypothetical protein [Chloroflexota bacterium]